MSKFKNIGFGILGTGMVADSYHQAIRLNAERGARLVCVSTRDQKKYDSESQKFGVPCIDWELMLDHPKVDIVCICTPSGYHALQALEAGAMSIEHANLLTEETMKLAVKKGAFISVQTGFFLAPAPGSGRNVCYTPLGSFKRFFVNKQHSSRSQLHKVCLLVVQPRLEYR